MFFRLFFRFNFFVVLKLIIFALIYNIFFLFFADNEMLSIFVMVSVMPLISILCIRNNISFDISAFATMPLSYSHRLLLCVYYNLFSPKVLPLLIFLLLSVFAHFCLLAIVVGVITYLSMMFILTISENLARRFAVISVLFKSTSTICIVILAWIKPLEYKGYVNTSLLIFDKYQIFILLGSLLLLFVAYKIAIYGTKYIFRSKWHQDNYIIERFNRNYWY